MDLELAGKRALVTGGSRGIGKATARLLALEGADVIVAARTEEPLLNATAEIAGCARSRVFPVVVDTSSEESVQSMAARAAQLIGPIDILVNSAAVPAGQRPGAGLGAVTDEMFWADMNVKVLGYLRCARAVAPGMVAAGWGRIVNVSGLAARTTGSIVGTIRNVSVAALTKNLADELGPQGINVTVVHPGVTRTEATAANVAAAADREAVAPAVIERRLAAGTSIGRVITADEVAAVIAFLASPRSVAINGDAVACGGGAPRAIHY